MTTNEKHTYADHMPEGYDDNPQRMFRDEHEECACYDQYHRTHYDADSEPDNPQAYHRD